MDIHLPSFLVEGAIFEIIQRTALWLFVSIIGAVGLEVAVRAFGVHVARWQGRLGLWAGIFLVVVAIGYLSSLHTGADLKGEIITARFSAPGPALTMPTDVSFIQLDITNAGDKPTVAQNFAVTAARQGKTYTGELIEPASIVRFHLPDSRIVTWYDEDWLIKKAINPIPIGGLMVGFLAVRFAGIDQATLNDALITVTWQDVSLHNFSAYLQTGGKIAPPILTIPGMRQTVEQGP